MAASSGLRDFNNEGGPLSGSCWLFIAANFVPGFIKGCIKH